MKKTASTNRALLKKRMDGLTPRTARMVEKLATAIGRRDLQCAQGALVAALASAPEHPEVLRLHGLTRHLAGDHVGAIEILRSALARQPGDAVILNNLGSVLRASGHADAAVQAWTEATEHAPGLAAAWYNLGRMLKTHARLEEACRALERAIVAEPGHIAAIVVLGDTRKALGDIPGAATAYRQVLRIQPGHAQAWFGLANLKTIPFTPTEATQLARELRDLTLADDSRIALGFAHAKALEDTGDYAGAFAVLADANARKRRQLPWDARAFSLHVDAILAAFHRPPPESAAADLGREVIFVVSLPRSGSTLTEQILAAHNDVEGASELPDLPTIIEQESRRRGRPFPDWVAEANAADWQRLGDAYLERTRRWREHRPRSTDKGLDNWPLVGAALAMLPAARVVVCRRDPLETCLACYRQLFANGQAFSYSIADLADYWHDFDRLCRYWLARHPERVCEQVHENLLADPEPAIRQLLDACALPFDPACLRPHASLRNVRTASAAQVRQPLRHDTARAARYGAALAGLRQALASFPGAT